MESLKQGLTTPSRTAGGKPGSGNESGRSCPRCGQRGQPVGRVTLEAQLRLNVRTRVRDGVYRFCSNGSCDLVYFDTAGTSVFYKDELLTRVGIKERTAPRPVCYCFGHTIEEIEADIRETGTTNVIQDIKTRMKEACWCQTKSPMGSCCLATVSRCVKEAEAKYGEPRSHGVAEDSGDCCSPGAEAVTAGLNLEGERASRWDRMQWVASTGGILSAVMASACCWLPLVFIALGISGVAVSSVFEAYRPFFTAATLGILAAGFYFAYRPVRVRNGINEECSEGSGDCCSADFVPVGRRFNQAMLWVATLIAAAFLLFPSYVGVFLKDDSGPPLQIAVGDPIVLTIEGMTCEACASLLQAELRKVPGVERADVRYETREAVVFADSSVTEDALAEVVHGTGYSLTTAP